ncbi:protein phosphatase 2C domain-containing protein [Phormidium yuhuli AB48]|uniref:Protein phosphatase 2C domain-containing protein n=1 Tax=Phormidium yuhuli AB48 TaxID=2940671 RepID=A0ABY5AMD7_9CYAN|nr:protein phosphatase 2C domain-containing protein [Phormidium yuhuli]USR89980.1 protein phosphatase 2C domain-containing protein [Phormidium yuhuli AB48]
MTTPTTHDSLTARLTSHWAPRSPTPLPLELTRFAIMDHASPDPPIPVPNTAEVQVNTLTWATIATISHIGKVRRENQDNFLVKPWPDQSAILAVVADGMGGGRGGKRAAEITVNTFESLLEKPVPGSVSDRYQQLWNTLHQADEYIRAEGSMNFKLMGMGATAVVVLITPNQMVHLYAGDSRLYHYRRHEFLYKTADHSVVRMLLELGRITEDDVATHPMRSLVSSCLGGREGNGDFSIDPKWNRDPCPQRELQVEDLLLLTSDGLHGHLSDAEIEGYFDEWGHAPGKLLQTLKERALDDGGIDNLTGIVIRIDA